MGEILRFAAGAEVVSEFPEGGFRGWHSQTLTECGPYFAEATKGRL